MESGRPTISPVRLRQGAGPADRAWKAGTATAGSAWGRLGRQVFAGAGDGQLAVFHALGANEFIGDALDESGLAPDGEYLQAIVAVQMDMERGNDDGVMVVLNVSEDGLNVLLVVVVEQGNGAGNFLVAELLLMLHQAGADHVRDGQGAVVVAFLSHHAIQLPGQAAWNRNAEAHGAFLSVLFHAGESTTAARAVNGPQAPVLTGS